MLNGCSSSPSFYAHDKSLTPELVSMGRCVECLRIGWWSVWYWKWPKSLGLQVSPPFLAPNMDRWCMTRNHRSHVLFQKKRSSDEARNCGCCGFSEIQLWPVVTCLQLTIGQPLGEYKLQLLQESVSQPGVWPCRRPVVPTSQTRRGWKLCPWLQTHSGKLISGGNSTLTYSGWWMEKEYHKILYLHYIS